MEFDITLTAKTSDPGGLLASFTQQLEELGGTAVLISETTPYKVTESGSYYFEAQRTYHITL